MTLEVAGVRLAAEIGLATVLGDSEDGLSIHEIAEETNVDGIKLGALRLNHSSSESQRSLQSASFGFLLLKAGSVRLSKVILPTIV
jgi:hypothetical protein